MLEYEDSQGSEWLVQTKRTTLFKALSRLRQVGTATGAGI